jgi:hypothetical protein
MKKFTLFLASLLISLMLSGQSLQQVQIVSDAEVSQSKLKSLSSFKSIQKSTLSVNYSKEYIYFEGFEESPDPPAGVLPEGWVQKRTTSLTETPTTDAATPRWFRNEPGVYSFTNGATYVRSGNASMAIGYSALNFTWAISPEIAIPTSSGNPIYLEYWRWYKNGYSGGTWYTSSYYVAIKGNSGTWNVVQSVIGSNDPQQEDDNHLYDEAQLVLLDDFQGQNIQIAIIYQSDGTPHWQMAIDDVSIYEIPNNDFSINEWYMAPTFAVIPDTEIELEAKIVCNGLEGGQPYVYLKVNDVVVQTVQVTEELFYGDSEIVEFVYTPTQAGEYSFEITMDDDEINANHSVSKDVIVYEHVTLAEDFENIDWTDPENPAVIFPPTGWNVTTNERDWDWISTLAIFEDISAWVRQMVGDPAAYLVTPAIIKTDNTNILSFWKKGLNNGLTINDVYTGHSTLVVKYSTQAWPVTEWTDLYTISFETGDAAEFIEIDISELPNGNYHFAFVTTSSFNYSSGGTTYYSHVIIDHVLFHKVASEPQLPAVTFNVDMTNATSFDPASDVIYITGNMLGWAEPGSDAANQTMSRDGESMIWTKTLNLEAGTYEYKFFKNSGWEGGEWAGGDNRVVIVTGDMTVDHVWGIPVSADINVLSNLSVYPNPFNNEINVNDGNGIKQVIINNIVGQNVMNVKMTQNTINTSILPQGIYLVTFIGNNGERVVKKMVKE